MFLDAKYMMKPHKISELDLSLLACYMEHLGDPH